jgi:hypothetical protein
MAHEDQLLIDVKDMIILVGVLINFENPNLELKRSFFRFARRGHETCQLAASPS